MCTNRLSYEQCILGLEEYLCMDLICSEKYLVSSGPDLTKTLSFKIWYFDFDIFDANNIFFYFKNFARHLRQTPIKHINTYPDN